MIAVDFDVLDVGQGTCNFIIVRDVADEDDPDGTVLTTFLVDMGSQKGNEVESAVSIDYVVKTLKSMDEPHIAALVLSHSDDDHINLVPGLLSHFTDNEGVPTEEKPHLFIDGYFHSGHLKDYKTLLPAIAKYETPDDDYRIGRVYYDIADSHLNPDGTWNSMWPAAGKDIRDGLPEMQLSLIIGNADEKNQGTRIATPAKRPGSNIINRRSLVTLFTFPTEANRVQFVSTGDAYGSTLAIFNSIAVRRLNDVDAKIRTAFPYVFHVTAPHHGSRATADNVRGAKRSTGKKPAEVVFQIFVDHLEARTLSASAGAHNTYTHPAMEILDRFRVHLTQDSFGEDNRIPPYHLITVNTKAGYFTVPVASSSKKKTAGNEKWPPAKFDEKPVTLQSNRNIFSTQYAPTPDHTHHAQHLLLPPVDSLLQNATDREIPEPSGVFWSFRALQGGQLNIGARDLDESTQELTARRVVANVNQPAVGSVTVHTRPRPPLPHGRVRSIG